MKIANRIVIELQSLQVVVLFLLLALSNVLGAHTNGFIHAQRIIGRYRLLIFDAVLLKILNYQQISPDFKDYTTVLVCLCLCNINSVIVCVL